MSEPTPVEPAAEPQTAPEGPWQRLEVRAAVAAGVVTVAAWVLGLLKTGISPAGWVALHAANPAYFLLDALPVVVWFLARPWGRRQAAADAEIERLRVELTQQRDAVAVANERLMQRHKQLSTGIKREQSLRARADEASRAKSQFLANMSHEIRTPMNGVLGMVQLLSETPLAKDQSEFVDAIRRSSEGLLSIINEVLDFSRIEAEKVEIKQVAFSPRDLVEDALELVAHGAHEKDLELSYLMDPDLPSTLEGDPTRIRQILVNFLGNAVKFTDSGEVYVKAELDRGDDGVERVRFSVVDTGGGIDEKDQDHLFQSFSQLPQNDSRGGTGLGLAIARKLTELMGGRIGVDSSVGRGSTFWFSLELRPVSDNRDAEEPVDLKGARVLVVSDNATIRLMLIQQMRGWNCRPSAASDGPSAISTLGAARKSGAPFTIVVSDLQMPGMDGLQLAQALRRSDDPAPPVLLLTRLTDREAAREAARLGLPDPVHKPVRRRSLREALSHARTHHADAGETTAQVAETVAEAARSAPESPPVSAPDPDPPAMPATAGHTVLLVDDNPVNRRVASLVLKKAGHTVLEAVDGHEAVETVQKEAVDLVLMDIHMPRMGGLEATQAIRAWEDLSGTEAVPIVAMTAGSMAADTQRCLEVGMDGYVSKPIKSSALLAAVDSWSRVASPSERPKPTTPLTPTPAPAEVPDDGLPAAVDLHALDELRAYGGDQADTILEELTQMFLKGADEHVQSMRDAVEHDDTDTLQKAAHTLKGSSGTLGAHRLEDFCRQLENLANEGRAGEAGDLVAQTADELGRVRAALDVALTA